MRGTCKPLPSRFLQGCYVCIRNSRARYLAQVSLNVRQQTQVSQLTQGRTRRLMYIECKEAAEDRGEARIGWVTFSKSGRSVYYQD